MSYEIEDEVDWSDGTLDPSPPKTENDSGCVSPVVHDVHDVEHLFEPQVQAEYSIPHGTTLPSTTPRPTLTRAQRARIGVHLNHREPSEQDYAHFGLYQANQKAYEAAFLKNFVNHALHSTQIDKCYAGADARANIDTYLASVSSNINWIANKMIWNAHCRAVNLLANAGKDGAPFWDINQLDEDIFADFGPGNEALLAHRMNESWHRSSLKPTMVRYTTKEYPIGHHSSPFEEIDDVADTLFNCEAFGVTLPTGRKVKPPTARKAKGRGLPGARSRDSVSTSHRDKWLASLIPPTTVQEHHAASPAEPVPQEIAQHVSVAAAEPRIYGDLRRVEHQVPTNTTSPPTLTELAQPEDKADATDLTRLEQLFEEFGADALNDHRPHNMCTTSDDAMVEQVPTWPIRLLKDHRRRLTRGSPQVFTRALPGLRAAIAEAMSQGYHPTNPNVEDVINEIEARDRLKVLPTATTEAVVPLVQYQKNTTPQKQISADDSKKRKRDQGGIRMFNKPLEPSKKKRKNDATTVDVAASSHSVNITADHRGQKADIAGSARQDTHCAKPKPAKQKVLSQPTIARIPSMSHQPHPSGSITLEPHQRFPPNAYFVANNPTEKYAWRCGIKHAMGHYYNAGDRKNCPGCFTALSDNVNAKTMDFYLPSRTHFYQPNPTSRWRPSKPFGKARRSTSLSHNSIAKEAYWSIISAGQSEDAALQSAIDAVTQHLRPKPRKEPTPTPTPSPPPPDLGPHPSGSATMEHGQDLPTSAYFSPSDPSDELAWRCDINHALGRYYLSGDKRSCPGCGSNITGLGKHTTMDFYLPPGVVVRQECDTLTWKPRKPYKPRAGKEGEAEKERDKPSNLLSHNQVASKKYWDAVGRGKEAKEALKWAVAETDRWLDEREEEAERKVELREKAKEEKKLGKKGAAGRGTAVSSSTRRGRYEIERTADNFKDEDEDEEGTDDVGDSGDEEMDEYDSDQDMKDVSPEEEEAIETSSDDESSSGSDSE